ncbi:response regulator transcription factor [Deinococcus metallilatus]|uniref:DNA-binding response OmpR family regulator n=1 Tax=Deinococcus metallilatus TaxID=1211322 RepID=A0AAJ5F1G5_9DEIO|nr:response regulator transcription factor [Deinococcus metallilatus]MBB5296396.1 DNA-binding response OmpR family regulator [Deinococcus metallilatus]QBY09930.1 response regulator transcription factor [Deinococcus metallilatus]RXJ08654.1 response regulator transcription factor [Deinococcus metallilatus]TLK25128.1 response regulator transcription factor [Deinococcus metallilatus]GMA14691.1 DNA-binding response regulator [Deinococcus metallilatus]
MARILIVDDDPAILEILGVYLRAERHTVLEAQDGLTGQARLNESDLAILDWMLPGVSGLDLARQQRRDHPDFPILLLTARGEEEDKLRGLEVGADDYVTKPFSPREVVARVRALLRRARIQDSVSTGGLQLDERTRTATLDGQELSLSKLEFDLLLTLARHPGFVWSRDRLLERVWGADFPGVERVVDVHMAGLRRKLGENPEQPRFIETVRGVGYRFREEA